MDGMHYLHDLMIGRLAGDPTDGRGGWENARQRIDEDNDRRRFRRMAENRKRQILERMLLDETQPTVELDEEAGRKSGDHDD
jgi:hypothetical protein